MAASAEALLPRTPMTDLARHDPPLLPDQRRSPLQHSGTAAASPFAPGRWHTSIPVPRWRATSPLALVWSHTPIHRSGAAGPSPSARPRAARFSAVPGHFAARAGLVTRLGPVPRCRVASPLAPVWSHRCSSAAAPHRATSPPAPAAQARPGAGALTSAAPR
ncbi:MULTISPECIES: hypothetical protein [unclassified Amycolatopsis]|uniref:hypothetical protein n=1 Tax=unclassified Amycolatopsis TaxID=2618356 RepID=UPI00106E6D90|nr:MULTISPECIES: hypothetical protein [unclassified Amycolatopsis]